MAHVTILGATGRTGAYLVRFALAFGYDVTVLARDPSKLVLPVGAVDAVTGDAMDIEAVQRAIPAQTNAVLSALGHTGKEESRILEIGMQNTIVAMKARGVSRLVVLGPSGIHIDAYDGFFLSIAKRLIVQRIFAASYRDAVPMETLVRNSDLNWTIVSAPRLTDEEHATPYRSVAGHNLPGAMQISRLNTADAMIRAIADEGTFRQRISIGN